MAETNKKNVVDVVLRYTTKGIEKANNQIRTVNKGVARQQRRTQQMSSTQKLAAKQTNNFSTANSGFNKVMSMSQEKFKEFNQQGYKFNSMGGRLANRIRAGAVGMRGFRMEMLGVMFFGMAMMRTFKGLMKTSLDWMGITELMSVTLGVLFLPMAELLLDILLPIMERIMDLKDSTKLLIGGLVLGGFALGTFLFIMGTLFLGVGSLILAFGSFITFLPIIAILGGLAAIGIGKLIISFKKSDDTIDKTKDKLVAFGMSGDLFDVLRNKLSSFFNWIKLETPKIPDNFKKYWKIALDWIGIEIDDFVTELSDDRETWTAAGKTIASSVFEGVKTFITEHPLLIVGAIIGIWFGGPVGGMIGGAIGGIFEKLSLDKRKEIIDKGMQILNAIKTGILDHSSEIGEVLKELMVVIGKWIGENSVSLIAFGYKLAFYISKGLIQGLLEVVNGFLKELTGINLIGKKISFSVPKWLSFQEGGIVPGPVGMPTPAIVHGGERIIPTNERKNMESTENIVFSPVINIDANVSSDYDVKKLAEGLKRYWASDFERLIQRRGSI